MWHVLLFVWAIVMASHIPKTSKQDAAAKRKHVTLLIPQKLEMIWRLESGKKQQMKEMSKCITPLISCTAQLYER
jgi:hypothetical protein